MYKYISDIFNRYITVDISEVHSFRGAKGRSEVKWKLNLGSTPKKYNIFLELLYFIASALAPSFRGARKEYLIIR